MLYNVFLVDNIMQFIKVRCLNMAEMSDKFENDSIKWGLWILR